MPTIVVMAACCHLWHLNHAQRVHEPAFAANVLVLVSCIRSHDQMLVVHVRLVQRVVWLLRRRLLALIDSMNLIPNDSTLEEFLLGPLLIWHRLNAITTLR